MYNFKVRPGYYSSDFLIDFMVASADEVFFGALLCVLSEINVSQIRIEGLWINNEIIFYCDSDLGRFDINRDIYGFVFIMATDNQEVILRIGELLQEHSAFRQESFDPQEYRIL